MGRDIWWADVIRARRALGARTPAEFAAIAAALGYQRTTEVPAAGPGPGGPPAAAPRPVPPRPVQRPERAGWQGRIGDDGTDRADLPVLQPVAREPVGTAEPDAGEILARTAPPAAEQADRRWSLLAPHSAAAILQYLLSHPVPGGEPDIARALELIAAGRPVTALPGARIRTLRFGAQILVDQSEGME